MDWASPVWVIATDVARILQAGNPSELYSQHGSNEVFLLACACLCEQLG